MRSPIDPTLQPATPENAVETTAASEELVSKHAADIVSVLDELAVGPEVREKSREWVARSLQRLQHDAGARSEGGSTYYSLDKALGVASRTLKQVLADHIGGASDLDDLQHLFKAVHLTSWLSADEQDIERVVEVVREVAGEALREIALEREARLELDSTATEDHEWSLEELRARLAALPSTDDTLSAPLEPLDRAPVLAIALQLALGIASPQPWMWERAADLLRVSSSDAERRVLPALLADLSALGRRQQVELVLQRLTTTFAGDEERVWLEPALTVCESADVETLDAFWPFLLERFATGGPWKDPGLRERTIVQLARMPFSRISLMSRRVQLQPGIKAGRIAASAFEVYDDRLSALYIALVNIRSTTVYGEALLAMVRRRASAWSGSLAFRLMDNFGASARSLLASLFNRGTLDAPGAETRVMAARILAQRLLELPQTARGATWIVPAIEAVGDAACDEGRAAVDRILGERRWLVVPVWSAEQRRVALQARARLGQEAAAPQAQGDAEGTWSPQTTN